MEPQPLGWSMGWCQETMNCGPLHMSAANRCGIYEATFMRLWTRDHSDRRFGCQTNAGVVKKVLYMFKCVQIDGWEGNCTPVLSSGVKPWNHMNSYYEIKRNHMNSYHEIVQFHQFASPAIHNGAQGGRWSVGRWHLDRDPGSAAGAWIAACHGMNSYQWTIICGGTVLHDTSWYFIWFNTIGVVPFHAC